MILCCNSDLWLFWFFPKRPKNLYVTFGKSEKIVIEKNQWKRERKEAQ